MENVREYSSDRKLLFLLVRLQDVNVPISWHTKFRLKVSCLFPCAVEGDGLSGHIRWKSSQDTFRTKCNINFHHFLKIGRNHSTRVSDHLHPHLPYVSCNLWRLEDMQFQFLHCLFLFVLPHYRRHIFMLHFPGLAPCQFQDSWFPKFCWPIFSICPCSATAVHFLIQ